MESVCQLTYEKERNLLDPRAVLSEKTLGRMRYVSPDGIRTEFQRDRDRITHSKAFRRLMHKTQVFLSPDDDHYRTRLTHTLEVSQIARTIARALRLNEDLTEAMALGHDLGHTPFGHAGERVLRRCFDPDFAHYQQSVRVVDIIEELNLTIEVRDGIRNHSGKNRAFSLEGRVVKLADKIAYISHDIEDACRADVLDPDDIPLLIRNVLGYDHSERIATMVSSTIRRGMDDGEIRPEDDVFEAMMDMRSFLFDAVYTNPKAKGEEKRAEDMLEFLYCYFRDNPRQVPNIYIGDPLPEYDEVSNARRAADYIAGMTDRYAINLFKELFIPKVWRTEGDIFNK